MAVILFLLYLLPFTLSQSVCRDASINCPVFSRQGLCNNTVTKNCMATKCQLSCGICKPVPGPVPGPVCNDTSRNCPLFSSQGLCNNTVTKNCMATKCKLSCGICKSPILPTCRDFSKECASYSRDGLCTNPVTKKCMATNCPQSCGVCGNQTTARPVTNPPGKLEFQCDFETDLCQWVNEPLEDTADWSVGVAPAGPSTGAKGSYSYVFLNASSGNKGRLFIPWELVLPINVPSKGSMCLKFKYVSSDGVLRVIDNPYPTLNNKSPSEKILKTLSVSNGGWADAIVNVIVDNKRQLVLEGVKGSSGTLAIDDIKFSSGQC